MIIFKKQVFKQAIGGAEGKTEIITIFNRYKDTFEDFIESSLDIKPPNIPKPIKKRVCNIMPSFENPLTKLKLDKNILNRSK